MQRYFPEFHQLEFADARVAWAFRQAIVKQLDDEFWQDLGFPKNERGLMDQLVQHCGSLSALPGGLRQAVKNYTATHPVAMGEDDRAKVFSRLLKLMADDVTYSALNDLLGAPNKQWYWASAIEPWAVATWLGRSVELEDVGRLFVLLQAVSTVDDRKSLAKFPRKESDKPWDILLRWGADRAIGNASAWRAAWTKVERDLWTQLERRINWPKHVPEEPRDLESNRSLLFNNAMAIWNDLVLVDVASPGFRRCSRRPDPLHGVVRLRTLVEPRDGQGRFQSRSSETECGVERALFDGVCPDRAACAPSHLVSLLPSLANGTGGAWCCSQHCAAHFELASFLGLIRRQDFDERAMGYWLARRGERS